MTFAGASNTDRDPTQNISSSSHANLVSQWRRAAIPSLVPTNGYQDLYGCTDHICGVEALIQTR
ncbi:hypothetical protein PAXRUDRAFT_829016 [Paxillus rubicundulus Ve08.2h10]|uniref:Uncharacterized protein n=1 Tax=Paxillus rubicundulus Ve08.2h10 TaxID=930991 RepID=A0A0D0E0M9_9AGAM|nr:hypothetical protein PAXRUDRAFT_829016 [Paxillus rubicundulus Ve08.2h10]